MLKLSQWSHNFSSEHFGTPADDFGALQRFLGVMVAMLSQMQGQYAMQNLLNMDDGLYRDSDGTLDYTGNWVMLPTLSNVSLITREGSPYAAIVGLVTVGDATGEGKYLDSADDLYQSLSDDFDATHGIFNSKNVYSRPKSVMPGAGHQCSWPT